MCLNCVSGDGLIFNFKRALDLLIDWELILNIFYFVGNSDLFLMDKNILAVANFMCAKDLSLDIV